MHSLDIDNFLTPTDAIFTHSYVLLWLLTNFLWQQICTFTHSLDSDIFFTSMYALPCTFWTSNEFPMAAFAHSHALLGLWNYVDSQIPSIRMSRITLGYMELCTSQHTKRFVKYWSYKFSLYANSITASTILAFSHTSNIRINDFVLTFNWPRDAILSTEICIKISRFHDGHISAIRFSENHECIYAEIHLPSVTMTI